MACHHQRVVSAESLLEGLTRTPSSRRLSSVSFGNIMRAEGALKLANLQEPTRRVGDHGELTRQVSRGQEARSVGRVALCDLASLGNVGWSRWGDRQGRRRGGGTRTLPRSQHVSVVCSIHGQGDQSRGIRVVNTLSCASIDLIFRESLENTFQEFSWLTQTVAIEFCSSFSTFHAQR